MSVEDELMGLLRGLIWERFVLDDRMSRIVLAYDAFRRVKLVPFVLTDLYSEI